MPENILLFTTHNTGIKHESFIAALSALKKTDVARLLNAGTNGQALSLQVPSWKSKLLGFPQTALLKELATN